MRQTQPLTAEESRIDIAMRQQYRTHTDQDRALSEYRMALRAKSKRSDRLERVADLLLGDRS